MNMLQLAGMTQLQQQAVRDTYAWIDKANALYGLNIPHIPVDFKLRGTTAGKAWGTSKIQYQPTLLVENGQDFLDRTVPHEVAHIVVNTMAPNAGMARTTVTRTGRIQRRRLVKSHGPEWQRVMRNFGLNPKRCYSYDTSNARQGKLSCGYTYACKCQSFNLTIVRHRRIQAGRSYFCKACKQELVKV